MAAKNKSGKDKKDLAPRVENRKARHDYHILEKIECGVVLQGSEVKSIRHGQVSLGEGFARVEPRTEELFLYGVHVAPYTNAAGAAGHEPIRARKLLVHKKEIRRLLGQASSPGHSGTTLIPLAMYFAGGRVKVEIGVCEGKKQHDKREDLKKRSADRDMQRAMTRKRL